MASHGACLEGTGERGGGGGVGGEWRGDGGGGDRGHDLREETDTI